MSKKTDLHITLLKEILEELRMLNTNLERWRDPHKTETNGTTDNESEDMDDFE